MHGNLVPSIPQNLRLVIIIVRVTDEKGASNLTPVGIPPALKQALRIQLPVIETDRAIETQKHNLRRTFEVE